ncbi:uncharacterized protein LOC144101831 [Amblyomma americanum]
MSPPAMLSPVLSLASMLLLLPVGTNAFPAKFGMYSVRNNSICAAVVHTGANSSETELGETPNSKDIFGNAEKLPLSKCRHPHDFVIVQEGRYALLSKTDVLASFIGRNYSYTFCVNSKQTIDFSCYRVSDRNGVTYFVAPTDYDRVLIRGPVGFYKCPQTYESLYDDQLSLIRDERQCATFLTVSSYGVRTDTGDCVLLYRYALFKDYPEVWNGCQRYSVGVNGNASYDCRFRAAAEPWNYPTREEVSRCAEYAIRVECSSVKFDSEADSRYFYAGHGMGEMTQNKIDRDSCQALGVEGFVTVGSYSRAATIGGCGILLAVVAVAVRVMCRMYLCSLCRREPVPYRHFSNAL